jgi:hypothetical protein
MPEARQEAAGKQALKDQAEAMAQKHDSAELRAGAAVCRTFTVSLSDANQHGCIVARGWKLVLLVLKPWMLRLSPLLKI